MGRGLDSKRIHFIPICLKLYLKGGLVLDAIEKLSILVKNEEIHDGEYKVELHDENIVAVKIKRGV